MTIRKWRTPKTLWARLKPAARTMRRDATPAEAALWTHLSGGKAGGLSFRRQHPLGRFVVDFYCAQRRLVIEVDGAAHEGMEDRDRLRERALEAMGLRVLRFTNDEVLADPAGVVRRILRQASEPDARP
ncbi:MAG TPA: endonuclease domain-containing protein [bacterium]|jgi:very-short-patch-repair endonuclease